MSLKSCSRYKDGKQRSYYKNGKQKSTAFRIWYPCGVIGFQQFWLVNMYNFNQPRRILPRTSFTWTNYQHKFLCLSTIPLYVKSETESWSRSLNFINNLLLVILLPNKVGNKDVTRKLWISMSKLYFVKIPVFLSYKCQ